MTWFAAEDALVVLHYVFPASVFLYWTSASAVAVVTLDTTRAKLRPPHPRRGLLVALVAVAVGSYVAEVALSLADASMAAGGGGGGFLLQEDTAISLMACVLVFGLQLAALLDEPTPAWPPYWGSWLLALALEPLMFVATAAARTGSSSSRGRTRPVSLLDRVNDAVAVFRFAVLSLLVWAYYSVQGAPQDELPTRRPGDCERLPLIPKSGADEAAATQGPECREVGRPIYGATVGRVDPDEPLATSIERADREARAEMERRLLDEGSWLAYGRNFMVCRDDISLLDVPR